MPKSSSSASERKLQNLDFMTWIKRKADGTYNEFNFVTPHEDIGDQEVIFPCSQVLAPDYAATLDVEIKAAETFLQPEALAGDVTIDLDIDEAVTAGSKLHVKIDLAEGKTTQQVTFGDGFAEELTVVVGITNSEYFSFVFDGLVFLPIGLPVSRYSIDLLSTPIS